MFTTLAGHALSPTAGRAGRALRPGALGLLLALAWGATAGHAAPDAASVAAGRALYERGVLASGAPLAGARNGMAVSGPAAACVNCHRRSGLGSVEGTLSIPPIAARYLFPPAANSTLPFVETMRIGRPAYTAATFARAVREGIGPDDKPLAPLMPRYDLGEADLQALLAYLGTLAPGQVRGVGDAVLHFATVVTPDADPQKARGVLEVIEHYFADKNSFNTVPTRRLHASSRTMASASMFLVHRRYELHVWRLTGPPAGWAAQLRQDMAREPVLALVSGIAGATWQPVHDFCEQERVPCLFPNVEVPVEAPGDFYSLYLSGGVLLEARLFAGQLLQSGAPGGAGVDQVYRAGDAGEAAARLLAEQLRGQGIGVREHVLPAVARGDDLARAMRALGDAAEVVLWLRPADVAKLPDQGRLPSHVYVSGLMAGLDAAPLPARWMEHAMLSYPVDLPERRVVRVDYPLGWFRIQGIPLVAPKEQVDTYLACGLLAENLGHLVDTFVPDYLVERMQDMVEHRVLTGFYPHLSLATGQQFASKGAYLVHLSPAGAARVVADTGWLTP